jgi:uncharacterized protein (DUF3084 family)
MDDLTLFRAGVLINHTFTKVTLSLDEIREKHPERKDLINSMSKTKEELQEVHIIFRTLEKEYRSAMQNVFRMELINMDLKTKIKELELEIKARDL